MPTDDEDDRTIKQADAIKQLRTAEADVTRAEQNLENLKKARDQRKKALDDLRGGHSSRKPAQS